MMKRNLESRLKNWVLNGDNAILVTGARQVGKTHLIREVLKSYAHSYIEINFIETVIASEVFSSAKSVNDILLRISLMSDITPEPQKTIVFLDEVQECPDIITWIKFLVEDGTYKYILSGSLLGVELKDFRSAPVGSLSIIDMYPMDISEFFFALNIKTDTWDYIRECFIKKEPVDEYIHQRLIDAFYLYLIIGGMPEAVQTYIDTNNIKKVEEIHEKIIRLYRQDFTKYEQKDKLTLRETYDCIPSELGQGNKRFRISHIAGKTNYDRVKKDYIWLINAGTVIPVYNVKEPVIPLKANEKRSMFKLYCSDTGLLTSMYSNEAKIKIINHDSSVNNGAIFENAVIQELSAKGYNVYYNDNKKSELDAIIERNGTILVIEVKSGTNYNRHESLSRMLSVTNYAIPEAYVLCNENVSANGKITYMPVYMSAFIEESSFDDPIIKMDLSDL